MGLENDLWMMENDKFTHLMEFNEKENNVGDVPSFNGPERKTPNNVFSVRNPVHFSPQCFDDLF